MKKTLQINIGGFFFTIEEEAYQQLNQYLSSLKNYFSTYESCEEIIQDIEARIAEKFYAKSSDIIEKEDVQALIASMGSVSDFEALKEEEDLQTPKPEIKPENIVTREKWFRDGKRKALGGVLAGLAYRYKFDVIWARMIFIVFALGLIGEGVGPGLIITYLALWIFLPVSNELEDQPSVRKFYRDPEGKVIAGVASGLAKYFQMDVKIMRIIFLVSLFLVFGLILYFLLWILAPYAHSVTQKLQLEGQALTIENIEKSVKSKETETPKRESTLSKILLFPFRIIGLFFSFLGRLVKPFALILKIMAGIFLMFIGISAAFSIIVALSVFFGILSASEWIQFGDLEVQKLLAEIHPLGAVFIFFAVFIPAIALIFAGAMLTVGKNFGNRNFWLTLLLIWFTGMVGSISFGTKISLNYAHRTVEVEEVTYDLEPNKILLIDVPNNDVNNTQSKPYITFSGTNFDKVYVTRKAIANGPSKEQARIFAQSIKYGITKSDTALVFDHYLDIPENHPYRNQELRIEVEIPKGKPFKFSKRFLEIQNRPRAINDFNYDSNGESIFMYNDNNELTCLNCPEIDPYTAIDTEKNLREFNEEFTGWENMRFKDTLNLNFENLKLSDKFKVVLTKGEKSQVILYSNYKSSIENTQAKTKDRTLILSYLDPFTDMEESVWVWITVPMTQDIQINNGSAFKMYGFDTLPNVNIQISGKSRAAIQVDAKSANIAVEDKSDLTLRGHMDRVTINVKAKSILRAEESTMDDASITASEVSIVELGRVKNKRIKAHKDSLVKTVEQ